MDPSALIFVALAIAWAVYLVPKALEHHDAGSRSRAVEKFSASLRVLGRRVPVSGREAKLVAADRTTTTIAKIDAPLAESAPVRYIEVPVELTAAQRRARRAARARATKRRRTVLSAILLVTIAVSVLAIAGVASRAAIAVPVIVLVAWLVTCRLMVRKETAVPTRRVALGPEEAPTGSFTVATEFGLEEDGAPAEHAAAPAADPAAEPAAVAPVAGGWDPVDVPLPTYVSAPSAPRRTVRTIDLDSTGVWSSGRNEADSALAREADEARATTAEEKRRQTGS